MALNCKPGDLAIIVGARYSHELLGHIVEVVGPWVNKINKAKSSFAWEVRYPDGRLILASFNFGEVKRLMPSRAVSDEFLRPLRDNPGQDETLQWAPVPHKETA